MRALLFQCLLLTSIAGGCGAPIRTPDPNEVFVGEVVRILWGELRRDELTSLPIIVQRYRQFGLRLKAVPDARVHPELVSVTQEWANASLEMSNVMLSSNQILKDDEALVQGAVRLIVGESPISVLDSAASRLTEKQRWDNQLQIVHTRLSAAQADFFRIQSKFVPDGSKSTADGSHSLPGSAGKPPLPASGTATDSKPKGPFGWVIALIRIVLGWIHSWFGWPGVLLAICGTWILLARCSPSQPNATPAENQKSV